jgi:tetratricopeptide (TPR) repeat protein
LSNQNKIDLNRAKQDSIEANAQSEAKLERFIYERIQVGSQGNPANSICEGITEDAKRLQNASSNYDRGLSKAIFGDLDGAEAEFSTAIELQLPVLLKYYFQRGNIRYLQKKFKESCIDYSKAIKINPQLAEVWSNKGIAFVELDRLDDAIKAFDKAIEINPQLAEAWYNKGNALKMLGCTTEANAAFAKAKELGYSS